MCVAIFTSNITVLYVSFEDDTNLVKIKRCKSFIRLHANNVNVTLNFKFYFNFVSLTWLKFRLAHFAACL
jgi:hypothetical protein